VNRLRQPTPVGAGIGNSIGPATPLGMHTSRDGPNVGTAAFEFAPIRYPDFTGGTLDRFNFLAYLNGFNAGDQGAECDQNGDLDLFDLLGFVNALDTGCGGCLAACPRRAGPPVKRAERRGAKRALQGTGRQPGSRRIRGRVAAGWSAVLAPMLQGLDVVPALKWGRFSRAGPGRRG
jgi:hypothetical protein